MTTLYFTASGINQTAIQMCYYAVICGNSTSQAKIATLLHVGGQFFAGQPYSRFLIRCRLCGCWRCWSGGFALDLELTFNQGLRGFFGSILCGCPNTINITSGTQLSKRQIVVDRVSQIVSRFVWIMLPALNDISGQIRNLAVNRGNHATIRLNRAT